MYIYNFFLKKNKKICLLFSIALSFGVHDANDDVDDNSATVTASSATTATSTTIAPIAADDAPNKLPQAQSTRHTNAATRKRSNRDAANADGDEDVDDKIATAPTTSTSTPMSANATSSTATVTSTTTIAPASSASTSSNASAASGPARASSAKAGLNSILRAHRRSASELSGSDVAVDMPALLHWLAKSKGSRSFMPKLFVDPKAVINELAKKAHRWLQVETHIIDSCAGSSMIYALLCCMCVFVCMALVECEMHEQIEQVQVDTGRRQRAGRRRESKARSRRTTKEEREGRFCTSSALSAVRCNSF